jgi:beta-RFAP synthase
VRQRLLQPLCDLGLVIHALGFGHLAVPLIGFGRDALKDVRPDFVLIAHLVSGRCGGRNSDVTFGQEAAMDKTELAPATGAAAAAVGERATCAPVVDVIATARLHLGFLDLNGGLGRRFGSIGLAIDAPLLRLGLRRSHQAIVEGPEQARAAAWLAALERRLQLPGPHELRIHEAIPPHAGLGSGTQLALALGAALRRLYRLEADPQADAALLGRGTRSGIGIALFCTGGLVVDGGHGTPDGLPPVLARLEMPDAWRIVLVLDRHGEGLSGAAERAAFAALPPMHETMAAAICRAVLMQALPAVAEDDVAAFGVAIRSVQAMLGEYFAPAQGGAFTSRRVGTALAALAEAGAVGIGQSSWGPTGFAFLPNAAEAARVVAAVKASGRADGVEISICRALNHGAQATLSR